VADVESILRDLTLAEKASLTAGEDFFSTAAIGRLGIPKIRLTDGPNGARGTEGFPGIGGDPSTCTPCATALAATWDPRLVEAMGGLIAREARDRGCRVLLAPTLNLHRSPLAGRNFECFSEDPLLAGRLGAAYVRGVQAQGVAATIKHFVGNEAEFERMTISSAVDERTLRELYLLPFEIAIAESEPYAVMTSYNRLNGRWLNQRREFLVDVLRAEWGFDGLVMTDWFASTENTSVTAGLDLEMPGPARSLGSALVAAVESGAVAESDIDAAVRRLLTVWDRVGALAAGTDAIAPVPPTAADRAFLRSAASQSVVLLTNDGTLPLGRDVRRIAVIGPHASRPRIMGGGAASVVAYPTTSFLAALTDAMPDVEISHARGCEADRNATVVGTEILTAPDGFDVEVFDGLDHGGAPIQTEHIDELRLMLVNLLGSRWPETDFSVRVRGTVVPSESGAFELALAQAGRARVFIDDAVVLDGYTSPPPPGGSDFFGMASQELTAPLMLTAGVPAEIVVEYARVETMIAGFRVGFRTVAVDHLIGAAVAAAGASDAALVFVGTTEEWEMETRDRDTLDLPNRQLDLIRAVAAANPRTVVVLNAGAPVDVSWVDEVAAVAQCWFGGDEMATGVVDVLLGDAEPGGRLPTTLPRRLEDNPSYGNFPGADGEVRYAEGVFMGYRGYESRDIAPAFAFGHGLSYTTFELAAATLSATSRRTGQSVSISVPVTNTGPRTGSTVVQCYVAPPTAGVPRPPKELKGFARVACEPCETKHVEISLDDRAFAYWATGSGWTTGPGTYRVGIGTASDAIASWHEVVVE
jgi:beta-glucosidase